PADRSGHAATDYRLTRRTPAPRQPGPRCPPAGRPAPVDPQGSGDQADRPRSSPTVAADLRRAGGGRRRSGAAGVAAGPGVDPGPGDRSGLYRRVGEQPRTSRGDRGAGVDARPAAGLATGYAGRQNTSTSGTWGGPWTTRPNMADCPGHSGCAFHDGGSNRTMSPATVAWIFHTCRTVKPNL